MKALGRIGASVFMVFLLTAGVCYGQNTAEKNYDKGVEYAVRGKFKEAKEEFEKALKVDPFYTPAKESLKIIEDVMDQKIQGKTAIHLFRAASYGNKGQWDEALAGFTKALEINPKYAEAYNHRGVAYIHQGHYDQAILDFTRALEINPRDAEIYSNRGIVYDKKDQYDRAISDYNKALEINPRHAKAYNHRGNAYTQKGHYDRAILDFTRALAINPRDAEVYSNRGVAYAQKGQHDRAISDYSKALEINPRYAEAYSNRGFVYMVRLVDKKKACSDWKRACELGRCDNYTLAKRNGDCE